MVDVPVHRSQLQSTPTHPLDAATERAGTTTEETLTMHAARITRGASIVRTLYKPWERLKALEDIEAAVVFARRILLGMERQEKWMSYGPGNERNGRREME